MISAITSAMKEDLATHNFSFQHKLEDIVANMQIASDLTITYREFEPLKVRSRLQEYLNQIPPSERNKYLVAKLQKYLYSIFTIDLKPEFNSLSSDDTDRQKTANYVKKWSKTKFYQQLKENNHGRGYDDPNWLVIKQAGDYWQVKKNDLTLRVKPKKHLTEPEERLSPGKLVSLKMPPNLVDHGLYIALGNAGSSNAADGDQNFTITQLYFNVNSEGALRLLDNVTHRLNVISIPFDFKVVYRQKEFDDPDNLDLATLEFKSSDFDVVYPIIQNIYQENQTYFQSQTPFFCQLLAPGLGLAEKPRSPNFTRENIGQHYCGIIAQVLIETWQKNELVGADKLDYVLNYLAKAGIDLNHLYLNPNSTETYLT